CANPGTSGGTCSVTFTSNESGTVTGNASVTLTIGGVSVTRSTSGNAGPGGSGPAVKTFVDANISITPNAVNEVGDDHTFTVTVNQSNGSGNGFVAVPDGTKPTVTLTDSFGATHVLSGSGDTCATSGT